MNPNYLQNLSEKDISNFELFDIHSDGKFKQSVPMEIIAEFIDCLSPTLQNQILMTIPNLDPFSLKEFFEYISKGMVDVEYLVED